MRADTGKNANSSRKLYKLYHYLIGNAVFRAKQTPITRVFRCLSAVLVAKFVTLHKFDRKLTFSVFRCHKW